jgi:tRNA (guanine-N7-)-methyltransferase
MKAQNLKYPTSWDDRHVLINDRVWFVPVRIENPVPFTFPGWNHPDIFGNDHPVFVEYCSGNGAWITDKAAQFPHMNWVAVEMKFDRVRKIWARMKRMGLSNLFILSGEGYNATKLYFPRGSVSGIYVNFPDPWPKQRHIKNRLIQGPFLDEASRILGEGQTLTFVTDDPDYSEWTIEKLNEHRGFESEYPSPYYQTQSEDYGSSYFEELWRDKGKVIRYHRFKKTGGGMLC